MQCVADLLNHYGKKYGIPRDAAHLIIHSQACAPVNPAYRKDAKCTTIDALVALCAGSAPQPQSYERSYRVRYNACIVRQGPARTFPEAGRMQAGETFVSDIAKWGEPINGDDCWLHLSSGLGYITNTSVERC